MKRLLPPDFYSWSVFSDARQIDFYGYLWVREAGNVVIDPVAISEADLAQLKELGGAALIVATNRDHARMTAFFREETGAEVVAHEDEAESFPFPVDRTVVEGDEVVPGMEVSHLRYGKYPGEIALVWPELGAAFVSDLLWGGPSGSFSFLPDAKLADPPRAALELHKLSPTPRSRRSSSATASQSSATRGSGCSSAWWRATTSGQARSGRKLDPGQAGVGQDLGMEEEGELGQVVITSSARSVA